MVYMEVVTEPNNVSDRIKAYLDNPQWLEHTKDPQRKKSRDEPLQIYNNTWKSSS